MSARSLKNDVEADLLEQDGVWAVGVGRDDAGEACVTVYADSEAAADAVSAPSRLADADVALYTRVAAQPTAPPHDGASDVTGVEPVSHDRTDRVRPVPGGVSVAHVDVTAGTSSFILTDGTSRLPASNNHVYADINRGDPGDPVLQPGPHDGGGEDDVVGGLADYVPIADGVTVDLAWADPTEAAAFLNELHDVTVPAGEVYDPVVGDILVKSGRTTAVTEGAVQVEHATVDVNYGGNIGVITLEDQLITDKMLSPGDSGSAAVLKDTGRPAALGFAGSSTISVFNYASNVEAESGLSILVDEGVEGPVARFTAMISEEEPTRGTIEGLVLDSTEQPVADATVSISGPVDDQKTTGTDGTVAFADVPVGDYTWQVTKSGWTSDSGSIAESDFQ